jgi:EpsD family peptidyl-prolyl cis-trans isomerase
MKCASTPTSPLGTTALVAAAILAAALAGCGSGKASQHSQLVAKVDDSEITLSQWNEAMQANVDAAGAPQASRHVVDGLIDEQLLYNQALNSGLDRDPAVVQALEHARREILGRAYTERMIFSRDSVGAAEQIEYYNKHPELFEKRKIYQMVVYTIKAADLGDELQGQLLHAGSPDGVRNVLSSHNVAFEAQALTRAAEQLPLGSLNDFAAAAVGDLLIMPARGGRTVMMLLTGIQDSSIDLQKAQPIIQQYLVNVRNSRALEERLKQMRSVAKITYVANPSDPTTPLPAGTDPSGPVSRELAKTGGATAVN